MREQPLESLRLELLRSGVAPFYVDRTIEELEDHYLDLESAALSSGASPEEAARNARESLGDARALVAAIVARPELLTFRTRHPRLAHCLQSAAAIGALPGVPLLYCLEHRPELTRWGVSFGAAMTLMGGFLAALNWLILVV